ncbi:MAG: alpha/beta fold hydrolase, partial [Clostridia bacterium]|nr:alpha/beta fold hydrolase [Clostridia bacterium]
MKVVEYGKENKDVIILLHGGGLAYWNYREVAVELSKDFHVVLPNLDGHAGSDKPFTSIESNASEIIKYIDENFGGKVLLIGGLSLGGQVLVEILSKRASICSYAIVESALVLPMKLTAALI